MALSGREIAARPSFETSLPKLSPIFVKQRRPNPSDKLDRLSKLPPELLNMIFEQVSLEGPNTAAKMKRGVSKSLLPFTNNCLYRHVRLVSTRALQHFYRSCSRESQGDVGSLVDKFEYAFDDQYLTSREDVIVGKLAVQLLSCLINAKEVLVSQSPPLSALILSQDFAKSNLSCLESVQFGTARINSESPTPPSDYAALNYYPRLFRVAINLHHGQSNWGQTNWTSWGIYHTSSNIISPMVSIERVKSLRLCYVDHRPLDELHLENLLLAFPNFVIFDFAGADIEQLSTALKACSSRLTHLTISSNDTFESPYIDEICLLPLLQKLTFECYTELTMSGVSKILERTTGPPQLKERQFNFLSNPGGTYGQDIRELPRENLICEDDEDEFLEQHGWESPAWCSDFQHYDMESVIERGGELGIIISGTIFESLKLQKAYSDMWNYVTECWNGQLADGEGSSGAGSILEEVVDGELGQTVDS